MSSPHPGNLLRTSDGRLCILDWGMAIALPKDLQYSLLEFIAHCQSGDFDKLPEDFVKLGATPPDKVEEVRKSGVLAGFAFIMKQISSGGGPSKITENLRKEFKSRYGDLSDAELSLKVHEELKSRRVATEAGDDIDNSGVAGLMELISKKNRDIFKLPAYMLYVVRAFSTLEGIGLSLDPNYSILQECYPYLAKRLLTDNSPRSRAALKNMIYKDGQLATDKLIEFSDGFTSYTATTAHADRDGAGLQRAQEAFSDLIFDRNGNMMQDLLVDTAAKFADSIIRVGLHKMKGSPGGQLIKFALKAPKALVDRFVPPELHPLMLPFTLPYDMSKAIINLAKLNETDTKNVQSLRILWKNLEPRMRQQLRQMSVSSMDAADNRSRGTSVLIPLSLVDSKSLRRSLGQFRKVNERIPVFLRLTRRLGANLLGHAAKRFEASAHGKHDREDDDPFEVELLLTEQLGTVSSVAAKGIARVLDFDGKALQDA